MYGPIRNLEITDIRLLHELYVKYAKVRKEEPAKPKWIQNLNNRIKQLRGDISHTQLILSCSLNNSYSEHQRRIRERLRYKFGNVKRDT